jgi:hypothetical protein
MGKTIIWFVAALVFGAPACQAAGLTPVEERWLQGVWPVLLYARDAGLPLDIVVQPQATPGLPPLAMAFIDQRCKFVLSLRGNPEVEASAGRIDPELFDATLQLMAAHELGHCWRHVSGAWFGLPAGHAFGLADTADAADVSGRERQAVRREEGYADLVGLAWTREHHRPSYARLYAWLVGERSLNLVPGGHHDTLVWARLATNAERLADKTPFAAADALWAEGLDADR